MSECKYDNRCGTCEHFMFLCRGEDILMRGYCDCARTDYFNHNNRHGQRYRARHSNCRVASQKCCKKYKRGVDE